MFKFVLVVLALVASSEAIKITQSGPSAKSILKSLDKDEDGKVSLKEAFDAIHEKTGDEKAVA